jgi:hypothetical protein
MSEFTIDLLIAPGNKPDSPVGIAIASNDSVFTRLLRLGESLPQDHLLAPPGQLAFWLVDNWWRLRYECIPVSAWNSDWLLAHDLSSIGGYAWPRLRLWAEGTQIGLWSRSDPVGVVGPVRYLTDALTLIPADVFEKEVDRFLDVISSEAAGLASDWMALREQVEALAVERNDPEQAAWRILEAQLGYDVGEAPDALMESLSALRDEYGDEAVAEAAMAIPGSEAAAVLETEIEAAKEHHWKCDLRQIASLANNVIQKSNEPPWKLAEAAAAAVRKVAALPDGPLGNAALAEILHVRSAAFERAHATEHGARAYGLRLNTGDHEEIVSVSSRWPTGRRFQFARALGDAMWSQERLGPLTRAKSPRQKFQRAFAQSLLCPYEALAAYIENDVSEEALAAAARYFSVSEVLVKNVLADKGILERPSLMHALDELELAA